MNCNKPIQRIVLVLILIVSLNVTAQEAKSDHVVNVEQLVELLKNDTPTILIDISKSEDFSEGHIPHARNVWRDRFVDSTRAFGGMMATRKGMQQLLSELGVSSQDKIILYDNKGGCEAARLWWILFTHGHKNTAILNGGLRAWKNAGETTSQDIISVKPSNYQFPNKEDHSLFTQLSNVKSAVQNPDAVILDTRSWKEYTGEIQKKGAYRKGRIPSSIFSEWLKTVNYSDDQAFKSNSELTKLFHSKGITKDKEIIVYCQSGVRSAHITFVLTELLGFPNVKNYDGSWIEWSYNKDLPIEKGELPEEDVADDVADQDKNEGTFVFWVVILPLFLLFIIIVRRRKK
ncbi:MAG: sulfurtransferase [Crocinitomicaceae bacterium]|nr:sulfurtransferase [Crocinitomicaceae bacterium]